MMGLKDRILSALPERHRAVLGSIRRCARARALPRPPDAATLVADGRVELEIRGSWQSEPVVFSTSSGVYLLDGGEGTCTRLLSGKFYGLTTDGEHWYAARSNDLGEKSVRLSDLSRFRIRGGRAEELEVLAYGIPGEVHQIDLIRGSLWIPHTGFNQILVMPLDRISGRGVEPSLYFRRTRSIELDIPRPSHLNSVFYDHGADRVYTIAHNLTAHTGRPSAIYRLDRRGGDVREVRTLARSAHNVYVCDGTLYYCDSERGMLRRNDEVIFRASKLLRGLSVTSDTMIVGGSDISFDRRARYSSDVTLYRLGSEGDLLADVHLPGLGNLYEIRQLRLDDHAMSAGRH